VDYSAKGGAKRLNVMGRFCRSDVLGFDKNLPPRRITLGVDDTKETVA
jgi:hypothetical protein